MAIYTDFFLATEDQLRKAFRYRYPVAKRSVRRKVFNPIINGMETKTVWDPAEPFPKVRKIISYPNKAEVDAVSRLNLVQWKSVDTVNLAGLYMALCGGEFLARFRQLHRPALVAPNDGNSELIRLPLPWIKAVAGIEKVLPVAKKWHAKSKEIVDRWELQDFADVLESLHKLAKQAIEESKGMFLWINV